MRAAMIALALSLVGLSAAAATADSVVRAQQRLNALGLEPGPADGVVGPRTRAALRSYQQRRGLPATGELDFSTIAALAQDAPAAGVGRPAPVPAAAPVPAVAVDVLPPPGSGDAVLVPWSPVDDVETDLAGVMAPRPADAGHRAVLSTDAPTTDASTTNAPTTDAPNTAAPVTVASPVGAAPRPVQVPFPPAALLPATPDGAPAAGGWLPWSGALAGALLIAAIGLWHRMARLRRRPPAEPEADAAVEGREA